MRKIDLLGKRIAVLGYGVENQALLNWFSKHGITNITVLDKNNNLKITNGNVKFILGKNYLKNLAKFDIIFRTPGIPYLTPEIQQAKKAGVEISSQIKLFFDLCPAKIIGVTGTKGKGTTSTLIYEILKRNFYYISPYSHKVFFGGNIGKPPMEFLDRVKSDSWVVLELSSFQLQDMAKSPNIAVVLDIKSDHLDYHQSQLEYIDAKTNIVRFQNKNDFTVINLDYLTSFRFAEISPTKNDWYFSRRKSVDLGAFVLNNKIILQTGKEEIEICKISEVTLRGVHNLENICASITASYLAGSSIKAIKEIAPKFKGLEHRLEFVGEVNSIKYYNDSFSTTPDTTIAAIKSFTESIILIVGGSEKGADYTKLGKEIRKSSVKTVIAIGRTGPKIIESFKHKNIKTEEQKSQSTIKIIENCKDMSEIIKTAKKEAVKGDVILLSPASASFDMFADYKDRGNQFREEVKKI